MNASWQDASENASGCLTGHLVLKLIQVDRSHEPSCDSQNELESTILSTLRAEAG